MPAVMHKVGDEMPKRLIPSALMGLLAGGAMALMAPAARAETSHSIEGITLGERFERDRDFQCEPAERLAEFNWCQRTRQERGRRGPFSSTLTVLRNPDGEAVYINRAIEPAFFGPNDIASEITRLSAKYGERARETNLPERDGVPGGVIAVWGKLKLEPLDATAVSALATGEVSKQNLLVDHLGDLKRSAQAGLPVYRLGGGAGFLWLASANPGGRGYLRFLTIDPAGLVSKPKPAVAANPPPLAPANLPPKIAVLNVQPTVAAPAQPIIAPPPAQPKKVVTAFPPTAALGTTPAPQTLSSPPAPAVANTTVRAKSRPDYTVPARPGSEIERAVLESQRIVPNGHAGDVTGSIPAGTGKAPPSEPVGYRTEAMVALVGAAAVLLFFFASMIERLLRVREPTGLELLEMQWQRELAEEQAEQAGQGNEPPAPIEAEAWQARAFAVARELVGAAGAALRRLLPGGPVQTSHG